MNNQYFPVIEQFKQIQKGNFAITLPDKSKLEYKGNEPGLSATINIYDKNVFSRLIKEGDVGLGEDYVAGLWDTPDLLSLMKFVAQNISVFEKFINATPAFNFFTFLKNKIYPNTIRQSAKNVHTHYDLGNEFYQIWLDESMTYSGAIFNGDRSLSLNNAQMNKYERIIRKLSPKPDERILEIGCGWGGFIDYAAKNNLNVTGITLSKEQFNFVLERLKDTNTNHLSDIYLEDYREVSIQFDHIVSIGMFEHVGEKFWPLFMKKVFNNLKQNGRAMIQTIIIDDKLFKDYRKSNGFMRKHIFPGGFLPCRKVFEKVAIKAGLNVDEVFHFGKDYAITMENWLANFDNNINDVKRLGYSEEFIRKWRFYLSSCAAMFTSGRIDVMQVLLSKNLPVRN